jgi:hypothetical protein
MTIGGKDRKGFDIGHFQLKFSKGGPLSIKSICKQKIYQFIHILF